MAIEADDEYRTPRGQGLLGWLTEKLALLGGLIMLAAALLVCASVTLRWLTSDSIPGDFEFVQIAVAISAFAFLPYCQARRGNIAVGTFTSRLPARVRATLDALWDLAYAGMAVFIAWRLSIGAAETIANKTTTMMTGVPIGWAIGATAAMAVFLALAAGATAVQQLRGRT